MMLLIKKPFNIGDTITIQGIELTITKTVEEEELVPFTINVEACQSSNGKKPKPKKLKKINPRKK